MPSTSAAVNLLWRVRGRGVQGVGGGGGQWAVGRWVGGSGGRYGGGGAGEDE